MSRFSAVNVWVFDLDNTLYPLDSDLWPRIDARITLFLMNHFGLDGASARALQHYYYRRYGTTLCGLMNEGAAEPQKFLDFVHDIDRSNLAANPALERQLAALPGRKLVFTNGSSDHALKTLVQLGIDHHFEPAFDIVAAGYLPKPAAAAYEEFFTLLGVDPQRAAMFEDIAKNLKAPHERGMATVLVAPKPGQGDFRLAEDRYDDDQGHIDFITDDLAGFLAGVNGARDAR